MGKECLLEIKRAIIEQNLKGAVEGTRMCLDSGVGGKEVIETVAAALKEVGDLFECGEMFLPEVMRSANAAKGALNLVLPNMPKDASKGEPGIGSVAIGSLGPHDIGKTIVASTLIGDGFNIEDLGISLTPERAEKALGAGEADILALSVLLTSDIEKAEKIITKAREVRPSIKVMVGGAAMNPKVASRVGADAYGKDASEALRLARKFMEGIAH